MAQKVHFIAIGGSAMHNLALALHNKGLEVTGSDDEIFEPSRTRLENKGILPQSLGWFPEKITTNLDAVILGMHARTDNPELLKAQELGIPIFSYPEFVYNQSINKQRIVIAGSHGKTTITSMIIHVLSYWNKSFDYLVGAQLEGFDTMVKLSDAPIIIIEGDEYLSSPIDRRPKFAHYQHHIGVISGIAWDHINVFPTFEEYKNQFEMFAVATPKSGTLIYSEDDAEVKAIGDKQQGDITKTPYATHKFVIKNNQTYLIDKSNKEHSIQVFGEHNLKNINAALNVCLHVGIKEDQFYKAISTFKGAANRLQLLAENATSKVYKDFAHSPSKLKATVEAVKNQFPSRKLVAFLELHTFSSLNKAFLSQYKDTINAADEAYVYFNPATIEHKKLEPITKEEVKTAFNNVNLTVLSNSAEVKSIIQSKTPLNNTSLLLMSSGNFDGLQLATLAQELI